MRSSHQTALRRTFKGLFQLLYKAVEWRLHHRNVLSLSSETFDPYGAPYIFTCRARIKITHFRSLPELLLKRLMLSLSLSLLDILQNCTRHLITLDPTRSKTICLRCYKLVTQHQSVYQVKYINVLKTAILKTVCHYVEQNQHWSLL